MDFTFYKKIAFKDRPLYPILVGILFLTNELRINLSYYTAREVILLILIINGFCVGTYFLSIKIFGNRIKAGLISVLFIIINIFYLDIFKLFRSSVFYVEFFARVVSPHVFRFLAPTLLIIFISSTILILKSRKKLVILNNYLNLIVVLFICIEIFKWTSEPQHSIKLVDNFNTSIKPFPQDSKKPDIYYILLDSYTRADRLKEYWNFDNSPFEDSLKAYGFYISKKSEPDYTSTSYCLAAYLNFSLLDFKVKHSTDEHNLRWLIHSNSITKILRDQGYSFINYSLFDIDGADRFYNYLFYNHYLGRTIWCQSIPIMIKYMFKSYDVPNMNLKIFDELQKHEYKKGNKPVFVYAHLMMPHSPFYFDEHGHSQFNDKNNYSDKERYLKQLIFTNKLVLTTIGQILAKSNSKPIIIIQGDHGPGGLNNVDQMERNIVTHSILNAYYLPGGGLKLVNDSTRPINTFRIILNHYFDQKIPLCYETTNYRELIEKVDEDISTD